MLRVLILVGLLALPACAAPATQPVPRSHPRLFGSRQRLLDLAAERPEAWRRTLRVAREGDAGPWEKTVSQALAYVIEGDRGAGRAAVDRALGLARGPVRVGHETFGGDLALIAVAFDLAWDLWTAAERAEAIDFIGRTVDANVDSETHVFHNGWYGYKNWGIGAACLATYHESPRAPADLARLYDDWTGRAAPALELAGAGGGWAEGYYVHYFLYEWLVFCEMERFCEGRDLCADAPSFFRNRAVASMFEMLPGLREYGSRRPIPMGDGGGARFGGDRDKALFARLILTSRYRDDPDAQVVAAYCAQTPRASVGSFAYKDFLWRDETVPRGDLDAFRRSHHSPGPGWVIARSDWGEDATHVFFRSGDRFTAHQHLDVNHLQIARGEPLLGDGGEYDDFASPHAVNVYVRSLAHNTLLVRDPTETWPAIRGAETPGNDGGQHHDWPHHNGAVVDAAQWRADRARYDIGEVSAYQDTGEFVYAVGDGSRAYRPAKLARFVRRVLYLRPETVIVVDHAVATRAEYAKTLTFWLQTEPEAIPGGLRCTNGGGRLFLQTAWPRDAATRVITGPERYGYAGAVWPSKRDVGPAPAARVEVSPAAAATEDWFVHVLTTAPADREQVPAAVAELGAAAMTVRVGGWTATFGLADLGGTVEQGGRRWDLATTVTAAGAP